MERWPKMVLCFVTILFVFVATVKGKPVTDIHQNIDNRNSGSRVQIRASRSETGTEMMKRDASAAENNIELTKKMDRKKRQCSLSPFDVHCHGYCPKTNTRDWEKLIIYWNCSARYEGTTYHCATINTTGQFVEACAVPKNCDKGTKPVITFPRGHKEYAEVDCDKCEENRYNPYEGKRSDSFSVCERVRRDCRRTGFIECDKVAGIERQWTNSKCMCDVRKNFIPVREKESRCSDDDVLMCIERVPCPDTPDGKRQEYLLSNHTCSPVCGEGYYQRSAESDECIPKRNITEDSNTTLDVTTDPMDIKPVTEDPVSPTIKNGTVITNGTKIDTGTTSEVFLGSVIVWFVVRHICLEKYPRIDTNIECGINPSSWKKALIACFCWRCKTRKKPPGQPTGVLAEAIDHQSIKVKWREPSDDELRCSVDKYTIFYKTVEDSDTENARLIQSDPFGYQKTVVKVHPEDQHNVEIYEKILEGLDPSTEYIIRVRARGKAGYGHLSYPVKRETYPRNSSSVNTKSKESYPPLPKSNTPNDDISDGRKKANREECKRILEKSITKIRNEMKHKETIEKIIEHQLFQEYQRKDLLHLTGEMPSLVNRNIFSLIHDDVRYYEGFKKCLKETEQEDLLMHIQKMEDNVLSERQNNTAANRENENVSTQNRDEGDTTHDNDSDDTSENNDRKYEVAEDGMRENTRESNDNAHQVSVDNTAENNVSTNQVAIEKTAENNGTNNQVREENNRDDNNRMPDNENISVSAVEVIGSGTYSNTDSH